MDFSISADIIVNIKEREKRERYLDLPGTKKAVELKGDDMNCSWCAWDGSQRLGKWNWKSWKSEDELRPSRLQHY